MTQSGYTVEERYRLDKRIAAGGVGQVWRATDLLLERPVAVKVLRPEYADHPDTLDRFRKEARNAGLLSHPHVAQVFDYGPGGAGCPPYLVMEFIDGPSLADILAAGPLAPKVALDVVAQTADGLFAAHRAGLVHRDVKPGNILIGPGGRVKVTDFGIAHAAGQAPVTGPGLVMGTAQYLAPERIAGGQGTSASDLYALGIVLHECLTGMPPFEGSSAEVMAAHLYLPPPLLPAGVCAEVDALMDRLTVKDPARRISDAGELAELAARLRDALPAGHGLAELAARTAPGFALGQQSFALGQQSFAPGQRTGYVSAEWAVPSRMSRPTGTSVLPLDPQAQRKRRRAAALAVGAALVTGTALVVLLVTGAFRTASSNDPTPAGSTSASATTPGARSAGPSGPAGRNTGQRTGPSAGAVPGATSPRAVGSSAKASPTASPSTSAVGTPSGSPSTSPSNAPTVSPTPTGSACILPNLCF